MKIDKNILRKDFYKVRFKTEFYHEVAVNTRKAKGSVTNWFNQTLGFDYPDEYHETVKATLELRLKIEQARIRAEENERKKYPIIKM